MRYEKNEVVFVLVHELVHVYLKSALHDEVFDRVFEDFLVLAEKHGLYVPRKYTRKKPGVFCGKEFITTK